MKEIIPVKRALISVSNKTGIFELASGLLDEKIEIISTGNTAKKLKEQGINSIEIYNIHGQVVYNKEVNANAIRISTTTLSNGVYIMNIKSEKTTVIRKLIIE